MAATASQLNKPVPGKPIAEELSEVSAELAKLWALTYLHNNTVKFTILSFKEDVEINQAVVKAKEVCVSKGGRFVWLEKAITFISD